MEIMSTQAISNLQSKVDKQKQQNPEQNINSKKQGTHISIYRHMKKRQGPPQKKQNKETIIKSKQNRVQSQGKGYIQQIHKYDKSKDAHASGQQYHMVSISQRVKVKLPKTQNQPINQQKRQDRGRLRIGIQNIYDKQEINFHKNQLGDTKRKYSAAPSQS